MDKARFKNKAVIVTGGASGIGKATATAFAQEGADLVLADYNHAGALEVATQLTRDHSVSIYANQYDAGDAESCRKMIDQAVGKLGRLDVLCNIAGIMASGHFEDFAEEDWERMLRINLSGVFYTSQRAVRHLLATKGNIVNVASAAGLVGVAYSTAYCASKAGVIGMTKSIAVEYASRGVRVNSVCPGGVNTPMNDSTTFPEDVDISLLMRHAPKTGVMCEAEDIARSILFLASEDARNITGIQLSVDGGQTAG